MGLFQDPKSLFHGMLALQNVALYEKEVSGKKFKIQNMCRDIKGSEKFCRKAFHLTFI